MAMIDRLDCEEFLEERGVRFEIAPHKTVFTGRGEAEVLHLPQEYVIKAVMLRDRDGLLMAVLPASRRIDMNLVLGITDDPRIRLATEGEIIQRFPQVELGALPPLPDFLGVRGLVDPTVFDHEEVAFADGCRRASLIASPRDVLRGQSYVVAPISWSPQSWREWDARQDSILDVG